MSKDGRRIQLKVPRMLCPVCEEALEPLQLTVDGGVPTLRMQCRQGCGVCYLHAELVLEGLQ